MFIVMFEFVVKEGFEDQFLEAWPSATQGIYLFKGSLGSRLHKNINGEYIAYAQWPDKQAWEASATIQMSPDYEKHRDLMENALNVESTKILYKMDVEMDYLQRLPFAL